MKNWKMTLFGVVYAVAVLLAEQLTVGTIDWWTIIQAAGGVAFGFVASDNLKAESILTSLMANWKTTLLGLAGGIFAVILPELQGGTITAPVILKAIGIAVLGLLANDSKKKVTT